MVAGLNDGHNNVYDFLIHLWSRGGQLLDERLRPAFDSLRGQAALQFYVDLLTKQMLPKLNLFGYGQVESPYGSGEFFEHVHELVDDHENVVVSRIPDRDAILGSIKEFLKTGR